MQDKHSAIILLDMNILKSLYRSIRKPKPNSPVKNVGMKNLEVDKWAVSDFVTTTLLPVIKNRPFPLDEQMLMTSTVCIFEPTMIFDWGTHIGKSARVFYEICKHFQIPAEIHSIDLPDTTDHVEHPGEEHGRLVRGLKNVHLHRGDGVKTALALYRKYKPASALFYVDGDHSYDSVYRELTLILQKVEAPTVLLHDTFFQSLASKYNVGPHSAIHDAIKKSGKKPKLISTELGLPGMTLLYF